MVASERSRPVFGWRKLRSRLALALDEEHERLAFVDEPLDLVVERVVGATEAALDVERAGLLEHAPQHRDLRELLGGGDLGRAHAELGPREEQQRREQEVHVAAVGRHDDGERVGRQPLERGLEGRTVEGHLVDAGAQALLDHVGERAQRRVAVRLLRGEAEVVALQVEATGEARAAGIAAQQVMADAGAGDLDVARAIELGIERHRRAEVEGLVREVGEGLVQRLDALAQPPRRARQLLPARQRGRHVRDGERRAVVQPVVRVEAPAARALPVEDGAALLGVAREVIEDDVAAGGDAVRVTAAGDGVHDGARRLVAPVERALDEAVRDLVAGHDVERAARVDVDRAQVAEADERDEAGEGGAAVDPAGEGQRVARRDDARTHDGERHVRALLVEEVLGDALRERVAVGVTALGEEALVELGTAAHAHLLVEGARRARQRGEHLVHRDAVAGVRRDVGGGDADHALQARAAAGEGEHVERRGDVRLRGLGHGQVELHRRGAVDDVRDLTLQRRAARQRVAVGQIGLDDAAEGLPARRQEREARRGGEALEATARVLALALADDEVNLLDAELVAAAEQLLEDDLTDEPGGAGEQDLHLEASIFVSSGVERGRAGSATCWLSQPKMFCGSKARLASRLQASDVGEKTSGR